MTYSILSLNSGHILASYGSEELVMAAVGKIYESEPDAEGTFAIVAFDDRGMPVEDESERISLSLRSHQAATA